MDRIKNSVANKYLDDMKLQKELEEKTFLKDENLTNDFHLNRKRYQKKLKLQDVFVVKGSKVKNKNKELGPITTGKNNKNKKGLKKYEGVW